MIVVNINNETVISFPDNISIKYEFIHSSERTPWIEIWSVNETGFYVRKICWRSGGAGHPSNPEDFNSNVSITVEDDYYCALGVDRYIGRKVVIDLGHAINASIEIGNKVIKASKENTHYMVVMEIHCKNTYSSLDYTDYVFIPRDKHIVTRFLSSSFEFGS